MSKQLLKSTAIVSCMTFVSRILGFIRDMVAAHYFGAGSGYDAFIVASKIPNFMRRLFAEGAFAQAFVPLLSEYKATNSEADLQQLINRVSGCLGISLIGVSLAGMILSPLLISLFAPGFAESTADGRFALASDLLKITFPYLFFISLTAFSGGILNSFGYFAVPALTPVFLNIAMIASAIFMTPFLAKPIHALAWGFLAGGVIQLLFQWPFLKAIGRLPKPTIDWKDPGVRRLLWLMTPALLGVSVNQLNLMLSSVFASFLQSGSVSWLYYAERLMEFPLGGFGVALATVVLPRLSHHHAKAELQAFSKMVDFGLRWVLLIGLPSALGLALLSLPLLTTLFQSGRFTTQDALHSQSALIAYAPGIIGFMLLKIFGSVYYAKQDIKTPVRIAMLTVLVNAVLSALLIGPLRHVGLALATSMAALFNAAFLGILCYKRRLYQPQTGWLLFSARVLLALAAMGWFIVQCNPSQDLWFASKVFWQIQRLAILVLGGIGIYAGVLWILGLRPRDLLLKENLGK